MTSEAGPGQTVAIRGRSKDEEGRKKTEMVEVDSHNPDTLRYVDKKMKDKGLQRMDRHPAGRGIGLRRPPPKSGHGGKFTWEGPQEIMDAQLDPADAAVDEGDPNHLEEEEGGGTEGGVEVGKAAENASGVSRVELRPPLS